MSTSIDQRVVQMKFDNSRFSQGVSETIGMLNKLAQALNFRKSSTALDEIGASAGRVNLAPIQTAVEGLNGRFSVLGATAIGVLTNIASQAVTTGANFAKSLTVDPIMEGFSEYETKLGSIQTIYSNTHEKFGTSIGDIEGSLNELNHYADKTIYSFGDMTRNIGLFTNAGLSVESSTSMIKGFSNAAAASGTDAQRAAGAAYQLSQGLSKGKITLEDWNSLTNAGMGNANMKEGLVDIAHAMGALDKSTMSTKDAVGKEFRDSLQDGWVTSDVMSAYLRIMSGDMDKAGMAALGLSEDQIKSFTSQQKIAEEAATKVRTFTQMMGTLKEAVGSGWGQTFEILFGGFEGATELFTGITQTIGGFLDASSDARNKLLKEWSDLGGRADMFKGIKNLFDNLMNIFRAVGDAFNDIFPPMTGAKLAEISKAFLHLTEAIHLNDMPLEAIYNTFKILFTVIKIGVDIVGGFVKALFKLGSSVPGVSMGFYAFIQKITDGVVAFKDWLESGDKMTNFFVGLGRVILLPLKFIQMFVKAIANMFTGVNLDRAFGGITEGVESLVDSFDGFLPLIAKVGGALGKLATVIGGALAKAFDFIVDQAGNLLDKLGEVFTSNNFSKILDAINTGLLLGLTVMFKKFLGSGSLVEQIKEAMFGGKDGEKSKSFIEQAKDLILGNDEDMGILDKAKESIKGAFEPLTDTLTAMQTNLKAGTLIKIAGAIGVMTASVVALSMIDSDKLTKALTALTAMFVQLGAAMLFFERLGGWTGALKLGPLALGLGLLAGALLVLTASVVVLSTLNWEELAKGLTGVLGGIVMLSGAAQVLAGNSKGLITAGIGLTALAGAIGILAGAVYLLSGLSWEEIGKGLVGVGGILAGLLLFTKFAAVEKVGITTGIGLMALAGGIAALALALQLVSGMDLPAMGLALLAVGVGIAGLNVAMQMIPKDLALKAAGLIILAGALVALGGALAIMGNLGWDVVGQALVTLGTSLGILAVALNLMTGTLAGSAALVVATVALGLLVPILTTLGVLPWSVILTSLGALALTFGLLAAAGILLAPTIPTIFGLAASLALLGVAIGAVVISLAAIVAGFGLLLLAISSLAAVGTPALMGLIGLFPMLAQAVGNAIITILGVIASSGQAIVGAIVTIVSSILTAIGTLIPQIVQTVVTVGTAVIGAIITLAPQVIEAVRVILTGLLNLIIEMTPLISQAFIVVMQGILNAVVTMTPQVVDTVITLCRGIITAVVTLTPEIVAAGVQMTMDFVNGIVALVPQLVDAGMRLIIGILEGISKNIGQIVTKGADVIVNFLQGIQDNIGRVADEGAQTVIAFINAVATAIGQHSAELRGAAKNLGWEIVNGLTGGLAEKVGDAVAAAADMGRKAIGALKKAVGVNSPSKYGLEFGRFIDIGLQLGIDRNANKPAKAASKAGEKTIDSLKKAVGDISSVVDTDMNMQPTITPVVDLSEVHKGAAAINGIGNNLGINASADYNKATAIDSRLSEAVSAPESSQGPSKTVVNFTQNNNSPKELSRIDIYRNTKNTLSQIKREVFS